MENVPGAIYRSAWHADFMLELISDEIERISGYPPDNFLASSQRTMLSIVHPDDRDVVLETVTRRPETTSRSCSSTGSCAPTATVRWVLDRGQLVAGPGGRLWMDGAMFDITERREAEEALRRHEVEAARTAELRASRNRIVEAADAARRKIERDLHDGAQQRLVALALDVQVARRRLAKDPVRRAVPRAARRRAHGGLGGAARAGPRHPPRGADRTRARARDRGARRARAGAGRDRRAADRAAPAGGRGDRVLHGLRSAHQRREVRPRDPRHGAARQREEALVVEVRDDGVGGARAGTGRG